MLPYRWMLAFGLGLVAIGGAAAGGAAAPKVSDPLDGPTADPLTTSGALAKAAPRAAADGPRETEPRVVIGAAVLRVYDEAGRVIYEE